jgi:LysM repeat protein
MIRLTSLLTEGSSSEITPNFKNLVKNWENSKDYGPGGWNKTAEKWYPHRSPEGGTPTIAYGHKLTSDEVNAGKFSKGLTDAQALALLESDLQVARSKAMALVPSYTSLPGNTQRALINACYRGELSNIKSPATLKLMNAGKWVAAAKEYLNHDEYMNAKSTSSVRTRMNWNAQQFTATTTSKSTTKKPAAKPTQPATKSGLPGAWDYINQLYDKNNAAIAKAAKSKITPTTYHTVSSGDTLGKLATKYKTTIPNLKKLNNLSTDTIKIGQKLRIK